MAVHATQDGRTALLLQSEDMPPSGPCSDRYSRGPAGARNRGVVDLLATRLMPPPSHKLPAQPLPIPPPCLDVIERSDDAVRHAHATAAAFASGWVTFVEIPYASLVSWSFSGAAEALEGQTTITLLLVAPTRPGKS